MFDLKKVQGIIFDYGGTIDSNGDHWAEVIWRSYQENKIPVTKEQFREAFVYTERYLAVNPIIKPEDNFDILLRKKINLQIDYLIKEGYLPDNEKNAEYKLDISKQCYNFAKEIIGKEKGILSALKQKYPMVLVSNFYGNVNAVLADFDLLKYFDAIIESAVVGIRKPDPVIFGLGVEKLNLPPSSVVVIGDSYTKDIVPASKIGCQTIWLKGVGWENDDEDAKADIVIKDFMQLKKIFEIN